MSVLLGGAVAVEYLRLARVLANTAVNGDVALMWYTAREWGRLRPRQPNIYGQAYGWSPEALPMEALRRIGVSPWTATMLVVAVLAVLGWFLLALAAWRRSHPRVAVLAVIAPSLLGAYYAFYVTAVPTYQGPHFVAIAGSALLLGRPRRSAVEWAAWTLLGLGLLMDPSAALIAAPVALMYLLSEGLTRRRLTVLAAGSVLPAAYLGWSLWFYRAHPDYALLGTASVRPSWGTLVASLHHPGQYFDLTALELVPFWPVLIIAVVVVVGLLVATRQVRYAVPAMLVPLLVAWGLATPKAGGVFQRFIPPGRIFGLLPHALWFLCYMAADGGALRISRVPRAAVSAAFGVLVCLAVLSIVVRQVAFNDRVLTFRDQALLAHNSGYGFTDTATLVKRCDLLSRAAKKIDAGLLVFTSDQAAAYGCGALEFGRLDTLMGQYERRTWRLYEERKRTRSSAVLADVPVDFCEQAGPRVTTCRVVDGGGVALTFPRQSVLALLERFSIFVRPFGPDCVPQLGFNFHCDHPVRLTTRELTAGPPPPDRLGAEAAIRRAFERSIDPTNNFASVDAGAQVTPKRQDERSRYENSVGRSRVGVRHIDFVSGTQAKVEVVLTSSPGGSLTFTGWSLLRDGSWLVDRNTFCIIDYGLFLGLRCSPYP